MGGADMTYWAVLLLTYGTPWEDYQSAVILPPAACEQVLRTAANPFLGVYPKGTLQCMPTDVPYSSPVPKARPNHGG